MLFADQNVFFTYRVHTFVSPVISTLIIARSLQHLILNTAYIFIAFYFTNT